MSSSNESLTTEKQTDDQKPFLSGEKGFAVFWLLFGLFFFWQSVLLYQEHPGIDSCASIPLFVSGAIVVCALIILFIDRNAPSKSHGKPVKEVIQDSLITMFPLDIVVALVMMLIYCIALNMGLGFYPSTFCFLWILMTWFMRNQYIRNRQFDGKIFGKIAIKNILWTAICLIFILLVFTYLFSVVLP